MQLGSCDSVSFPAVYGASKVCGSFLFNFLSDIKNIVSTIFKHSYCH